MGGRRAPSLVKEGEEEDGNWGQPGVCMQPVAANGWRDLSVQSGTDPHMTNGRRWGKARLTSEILARPDDRFDKAGGQGSVSDIIKAALCTA